MPWAVGPTSMRTVLRVVFASSVAAFAGRPLAQTPPSAKDLEKLATDFLAADSATAAGHGRQHEILARLDAVPAPTPVQLQEWEKKFDKLQEKGRLLERAGDNWFWDDREKKAERVLADRRGR